jgi:hypothetical protein
MLPLASCMLLLVVCLADAQGCMPSSSQVVPQMLTIVGSGAFAVSSLVLRYPISISCLSEELVSRLLAGLSSKRSSQYSIYRLSQDLLCTSAKAGTKVTLSTLVLSTPRSDAHTRVFALRGNHFLILRLHSITFCEYLCSQITTQIRLFGYISSLTYFSIWLYIYRMGNR